MWTVEQLNAYGGRVEIGAVAGAGTIGLNADDSFSFPVSTPRANVAFTNGSQVDVTLGNGGDIGITAGNIDVLGSSRLLAGIDSGFGASGSQAGDITLNATRAIAVSNSVIYNEVGSRATGNAGNIDIRTNSLALSNIGEISSITYGQGNAGNILVQANDFVSLKSIVANPLIRQRGSQISSVVNPDAVGNSGNVSINTGSLSMTGAQLSSFTAGQGNAGSIFINASRTVSLDEGSGIFNTITFGGRGNGGTVNINAESLSIAGRSQVLGIVRGALNNRLSGQGNAANININIRDSITISGTLLGKTDEANIVLPNIATAIAPGATGIAGNITIKARSLSLTDFAEINSTLDPGATGTAGNINLQVDALSANNGAQISASTSGQGNAGNITINAHDRISFDGTATALSSVGETGSGQGGKINITTGTLSLTHGAQLRSSTGGQGDAGSIIINAREHASFDGTSADGEKPSDAISSVLDTGHGRGGNVQITAGSLSVSNGARLRTDTSGQGDAGRVIIDVRDRVSLNNGDIFSTVEQSGVGQGGKINIATGALSVINGGKLSASTFGQGNAGDIRVDTNSLSLSSGGELRSTTSGRGNSGNIIINAPDHISIDGVGSNGDLSSGVFTNVQATGHGQGGKIDITTGSLSLTNSGELSSTTSGQGDAGNITINALNRISIDGVSPNGDSSSGVFTTVEETGHGRGGNIHVNTDSLSLTNGGQLIAITLGQGDAGNVTVNANLSVLVSGVDRRSRIFSAISTGTDSLSNVRGGDIQVTTPFLTIANGAIVDARTYTARPGGNIFLNADTLSILNGGQVSTTNSSAGRAGNITVNTDRITLSGRSSASQQNPTEYESRGESGLFANTRPNSQGQGGTINITTRQLNVRDSARIATNSQGTGQAGNLNITAHSVSLDRGNITAETVSSQGGSIRLRDLETLQVNNGSISASTRSGQGGDLRINSDSVVLNNSNLAVAATDRRGQAGNLAVTTNDMRLNQSQLTAQTRSARGDGANIRLQEIDRLLYLQNGSQISARAFDNANGGNVAINAGNGFVVARTGESQNNDIIAKASGGNGGQVSITAQGILGLEQRPSTPVNTTNDIDVSSDQGLQGTVTLNIPNVDPSRGLTELPTVPIDATNQIADACPTTVQEADRLGSFIVSGRGGLPPSPIDLLSEDNVLTEWVTSRPESRATVEVPTALPNQAIVEAQGWVKGENGEIRLVAKSPTSTFNLENCRSVSNP